MKGTAPVSYTHLDVYKRQDLRCSAISGYASWNGEEHGWNLAWLEEGSYYMDITWCDHEIAVPVPGTGLAMLVAPGDVHVVAALLQPCLLYTSRCV